MGGHPILYQKGFFSGESSAADGTMKTLVRENEHNKFDKIAQAVEKIRLLSAMFLDIEVQNRLPNCFPTTLYENVPEEFRLRATAAKTLDPDGFALTGLGGSWHALAYRLISANEHASDLAGSLHRFGTMQNALERYKQEKELYELFCCGLSSIETGCRAASIILACVPNGKHRFVLNKQVF